MRSTIVVVRAAHAAMVHNTSSAHHQIDRRHDDCRAEHCRAGVMRPQAVRGRLSAQLMAPSFSDDGGAGGPAGGATESCASPIADPTPDGDRAQLFERRTARRTPGCATSRERPSRPRTGRATSPEHASRHPYKRDRARTRVQAPVQASTQPSPARITSSGISLLTGPEQTIHNWWAARVAAMCMRWRDSMTSGKFWAVGSRMTT